MPTLLPTMNANLFLNLLLAAVDERLSQGCFCKKLNLARGAPRSTDTSFSAAH